MELPLMVLVTCPLQKPVPRDLSWLTTIVVGGNIDHCLMVAV